MMEGRSHDTLQDFLFLDCVFAGVCVCVCVCEICSRGGAL